jgi:hypothetical protein
MEWPGTGIFFPSRFLLAFNDNPVAVPVAVKHAAPLPDSSEITELSKWLP